VHAQASMTSASEAEPFSLASPEATLSVEGDEVSASAPRTSPQVACQSPQPLKPHHTTYLTGPAGERVCLENLAGCDLHCQERPLPGRVIDKCSNLRALLRGHLENRRIPFHCSPPCSGSVVSPFPQGAQVALRPTLVASSRTHLTVVSTSDA
jgi:hypothetical protein